MTKATTVDTRIMRVRTIAMAAALVLGGSALAQNVLVFVNGEPITAIDVEQRSRFIQVTTQKQPSRQSVLDTLIDEKLKVREAKRWGINIPDKEVESSFARMASGMRMSPDQLTQQLGKSGVNSATLKARIKADLAWSNVVRGRYQSRLQLSDSDVTSLLGSGNPEAADTVGYDYMLRPILFLVPPGSNESVYASRRKEAEALRGRFNNCEEDIPAVRAMRDVAVRDPVIRTSADVPEAQRKILDSVPLGRLTAPEMSRHGIEMFAVCSKTETKTDTPRRREIRDKLATERFERESKRYLRLLRKNAMIERGR